MASTLGQAVAGQGRSIAGATPTFGRNVRDNIARQTADENAKKKAEDDELVDIENDFTVKDKGLQPWAIDETMKLKAQVINQYHRYYKENPSTAKNRTKEYVRQNDLDARLLGVRGANDNALKSIADKDDLGHKQVAEILATAKTVKERNERLAALNDRTSSFDDLGNFARVATYEYDHSKFKADEKRNYDIAPATVRDAGGGYDSIEQTKALKKEAFDYGFRNMAQDEALMATVYAKASPQQKAVFERDQQALIDATAQEALDRNEQINPAFIYGEKIYKERQPRETPEEAAAKAKARAEAKPETGKYSWDMTTTKDGSREFIMNNIGDATQNKEVDLYLDGYYISEDEKTAYGNKAYRKLPKEEQKKLTKVDEQVVRGVPNKITVAPDGEMKIVLSEKISEKDGGGVREVSVRGGYKGNITKVLQQFGGEQLGSIEQKIKANGGKTLVLGQQKVGAETQVQTPLQQAKGAEKYPLPDGKPMRGKKAGVWYVWDESIGKYVKE